MASTFFPQAKAKQRNEGQVGLEQNLQRTYWHVRWCWRILVAGRWGDLQSFECWIGLASSCIPLVNTLPQDGQRISLWEKIQGGACSLVLHTKITLMVSCLYAYGEQNCVYSYLKKTTYCCECFHEHLQRPFPGKDFPVITSTKPETRTRSWRRKTPVLLCVTVVL